MVIVRLIVMRDVFAYSEYLTSVTRRRYTLRYTTSQMTNEDFPSKHVVEEQGRPNFFGRPTYVTRNCYSTVNVPSQLC